MDYDAIVGRLTAYRKKCNLRQHEMAADLHMSQSQYSKVESGKIKISYDNLYTLRAKGCDTDLLITGKENGQLLPCLENLLLIEDDNQFLSFMKLCEWAWEQWEKDGGILDEIGGRLLKLWVSMDGQDKTQWARLRKAYHDISQMNMATQIGVNIKKYRLLERNQLRPDAELLLNIYELTECRPEFFMDEKAYYLSLINDACKGNQQREEQLQTIMTIMEKFGQ